MSFKTKEWVAVGAASVLSIGVLAGGAVTTANAMPLFTGNDSLEIPGLTVNDDGSIANEQGADVSFDVTSDSIVSPSPTSPASTDSPVSPASASPASPASPMSPASASAPSPASVASPPSPASPDSPASVNSPGSVDSAD